MHSHVCYDKKTGLPKKLLIPGIFLITAALQVVYPAYAQDEICGMVATAEVREYLDNPSSSFRRGLLEFDLAEIMDGDVDSLFTVCISAHIIRKTDGTGASQKRRWPLLSTSSTSGISRRDCDSSCAIRTSSTMTVSTTPFSTALIPPRNA